MDKAIVKNTGELLDIKAAYITKQISFELPNELLESMKDIKDSNNVPLLNNNTTINIATKDSSPSEYYLLSDNKQYEASDIVIGKENIREYKIQTLTEKPNS